MVAAILSLLVSVVASGAISNGSLAFGGGIALALVALEDVE